MEHPLTLYVNNMKTFFLAFLVLLVIGCATKYDKLQPLVTAGAPQYQAEKYLSDRNMPYTFFTCKGGAGLSFPANQCKFHDSIGLYQALIRERSYVLGMLKCDEQLVIEIGPNKRVVNVSAVTEYHF